MKFSSLLSSNKPKETTDGSSRSVLLVWAIPLISFVLLVITVYYVVYPWFTDTQSKRAAIKSEQSEIAQLREKLEVLQSYDEDILKQYLLRLSLSVPAQDSPPLVMATVEQAVNSAGMVLETVQYGGLTETEKKEEEEASPTEGDTATQSQAVDVRGGDVNLIVSARGDFSTVNSFLKTVRTVNPLIVGVDIRVSDLTQANGEVSTVSKELSFKGMAPFQSLPEDLGTLTSDVSDLNDDDLQLIEQLSSYVTFYEVRDASNPDRYNTGKENPF